MDCSINNGNVGGAGWNIWFLGIGIPILAQGQWEKRWGRCGACGKQRPGLSTSFPGSVPSKSNFPWLIPRIWSNSMEGGEKCFLLCLSNARVWLLPIKLLLLKSFFFPRQIFLPQPWAFQPFPTPELPGGIVLGGKSRESQPSLHQTNRKSSNEELNPNLEVPKSSPAPHPRESSLAWSHPFLMNSPVLMGIHCIKWNVLATPEFLLKSTFFHSLERGRCCLLSK